MSTRSLQFFHFGLMPYPHIPPAEELTSTWVTLSNRHYDPELGHRLYNEYLDHAVLAERLGYDGTCVNEHHQNAYGTMPDPNVMASHIVARTSKIRVGIVGNALPLHDNPLRVAESVAMLDVISGGRIISGFVRGTGMEYHSLRANPATSRERFWEAHDLIVKAWADDGPFDWQGKHFDIPYVNPWPRPLQKPHPPIWLPGQGSFETIREAAKRRYPFMMVFAPLSFTKVNYDMYRKAAAEFGYEPAPEQLAFCVPTYVAETEAKAHEETREHMMWLFSRGLKIPDYHWLPPGYLSGQSLRGMIAGKRKFGIKDHVDLTYQDLLDEQYILVGTPAQVAEKLAAYTEDLGAGIHVGSSMQVGDMPSWKVEKNMTLFAEEVMPLFRPPGNQPAWARGVPVPGSPESLNA
ncbi:LLM class flavin-dependent oxidoreductase [Pseudonocardia eucalypti]|uniref:LLM class flavin-dependent oxidoreductase n=1 Tax=Pseudonocardia eucalypti TaxID=648755 RepID=A0ABP9QM95_9PSEU|nr:alkanesulfonate monooxygenase SsuD/methylene tetrahydromethanopterin reductase-like flavin-dependent oxidoreductase (luciferase family) [Pseudonocardia eucalypti]